MNNTKPSPLRLVAVVDSQGRIEYRRVSQVPHASSEPKTESRHAASFNPSSLRPSGSNHYKTSSFATNSLQTKSLSKTDGSESTQSSRSKLVTTNKVQPLSLSTIPPKTSHSPNRTCDFYPHALSHCTTKSTSSIKNTPSHATISQTSNRPSSVASKTTQPPSEASLANKSWSSPTFSSKNQCHQCGKGFLQTGTVVKASGVSFHSNCFNCARCHKNMFQKRYIELEGNFYCEECGIDIQLSKQSPCFHCKKPLIGDCIEALGRGSHRQ